MRTFNRNRVFFGVLMSTFIAIWLLSVQTIQILLGVVALLLGLLWYAYSQNIRILYLSGTVILMTVMISTAFSAEIAKLRFHAMDNFYQSYIESHYAELAQEGTAPYRVCDGNLILSNLGRLEIENGEHYSVYFPISESFFHSKGYLYVDDELAYETNSVFSADEMDRIIPLSNNWAYVKVFNAVLTSDEIAGHISLKGRCIQ